MPNESESVPQIRPSDLQDPTLTALNNMFGFIYSQLAQTQGISGDTFQFKRAESASTSVPTDDHAFLTLGAYRKLAGGNAPRDVTPIIIPSTGVGNSSDTEVIFNSHGTLTGDPHFTWANASKVATIIGISGVPVNIGSQVASTGMNMVDPLTGNTVNGGAGFWNCLLGGIPTKTIWAIAGDGSNKGILRLSDGSGSGGWDSNGAQIYGQASTGLLQFIVGKIGSYSGGNQVNIGLDYINSLKIGTAGLTMWALGQSGNAGVLRLSNGSGAGGFDGNGAQIYATASNGVVQAIQFTAVQGGIQTNIGSSSASTGMNIQASSLTGNKLNAGPDFINSLNNGTAGATIWALGQSGANAILRLSNGSGTSGWDGNGAQIYAQASIGLLNAVSLQIGSYSGGNKVNVGLDFINSLKTGTGGLTIWALGQSGNVGLLRLSNGSGAGGLDGNGAYVYADGTTLRMNNLTVASGGAVNFTGCTITAPSGGFGITAVNLPITHITVSAGLVTNVT